MKKQTAVPRAVKVVYAPPGGSTLTQLLENLIRRADFSSPETQKPQKGAQNR